MATQYIYRSYDDVLRYYMKSERSNLKGLDDSPYHNKNGEMGVDFINYKYVSFLHMIFDLILPMESINQTKSKINNFAIVSQDASRRRISKSWKNAWTSNTRL